MLCYKDMTFCSYYVGCAKGAECPRALTKEVIAKAEQWMADPPICQFAQIPECFTTEKELNEN